MDFKTHFPHIFKRTVHIKLDRLKIPSFVSEKSESSEKQNVASLRVTRSKKIEHEIVEWVRISIGCYKGDIAQVDVIDRKNNKADLIFFPRINYENFSNDSFSCKKENT